MQKDSTYFNKEELYYLEKTLKVSRKELIETIRLSHTSATVIANYVRKKILDSGTGCNVVYLYPFRF